VPRRTEKTRGGSPWSTVLLLLLMPTGLAVGFGSKEFAYPPLSPEGFTPRRLGPPFPEWGFGYLFSFLYSSRSREALSTGERAKHRRWTPLRPLDHALRLIFSPIAARSATLGRWPPATLLLAPLQQAHQEEEG
jgi:hypothetical protein